MDEETLKGIAMQLRKPTGDYAIQVGEKMNDGNLHINLNTIEALNLNSGDHILEIGMGNGFFVKNVLSQNSNLYYVGCDFSQAMVDEARKCNAQFIQDGQAAFHNADANQLPFSAESFDKVFTINTIYFWEKPQDVLSEIWRVLKPKGQITIAVRPKSIMEHYPFVKYGFNMFSTQELKETISKNDFMVTDAFEKEEPEIEINGERTKTATLVVTAVKS